MKHKFSYLIVFLIALTSMLCCNCSKDDSKGDDSGKPYLRVSFSEKMVGNSSGSLELYVTSNTSWMAEARSSWLHVDRTSGKNNLSVRISYDQNEDPTGTPKRTGVVRFTAEGVNPVEVIITQSALTFTNPITLGGNIATMPDPYIVKDGDKYYACKAGSNNSIAISMSSRLSVIEATKAVWHLPYDDASKPWNIRNLWAPELFHIDGHWYVYYAAGRYENNSYGDQRTGVIRSKTADPLTSEWEDMGMIYTGESDNIPSEITVDNTEYAIDMTTFELKGQRYAVWSGNRKDNSTQQIRIAKMSNPYTICSGFKILSSPEQSWEKVEGKVNEGPAILINEEKGKLFIVYSCNGSWTEYYRLGWLMLDIETGDPMNPADWTKSSNYVFWRCDNSHEPTPGVNGVGHCTFTKSPDGTEDWIVYHAMKYHPDYGGGWTVRYPFIQKFTWNDDGTPNFGDPVGWGETQLLPSGETL